MVLRIRYSRLESNVLQHLNLLSVFPKEYYKHIFRIGFPTAIQGSIYCFISMVLTRMVSGYGAAAIATQRVGGQIESVSWNTADGFASALNAFIAQNYGARKKDRIRKGYSLSFRVLTIWGLFVTAAFVFLPEPIARLFFHEKEALDTAVNYLVIIGFSEVFMSIELMTAGALSGLGTHQIIQHDQCDPDRLTNPAGIDPDTCGNGIKWCMVGAYNLFYREGNRVYTDIPAYQQAVA